MPNRRTQHPAPILKHQDSSDSSSGSDTNSDDCPLPFASCAAASSFHTTRVRFPPPAQLAHAELTYPPCAYDRAPIVVTPNTCALPRRGARFYPCPLSSSALDSDSSDDNGAAPVRCARTRTRRNVTPPSVSNSASTAAQDALAAASIAVPPTMAPGSALAFLPHAPAQQQACPQEKKKRRSQTPASPRRRCAAAARASCSFDSAEADSCLGGF